MYEWATNDGVGRAVVTNIQIDGYLAIPSMVCLLRCVLDNSSKPLDILKLTTEFENTCKKHILQGNLITVSLPHVVGRATDKNKLIKTLKTDYFNIFLVKPVFASL